MAKEINVKDIKKRYSAQLKFAKENYLKDTGYKIARGFKQSKEYKRILRNEKSAIYRFENRDILKAKREQKRKDLQTVGQATKGKGVKQKVQSFKADFDNVIVYVIDKPFYNVLSYGSKSDKAAVKFFKDNKADLGEKFFAIIDRESMDGGGQARYINFFQYQKAIQQLFQDSQKLQDELNLDSMAIVVSVMEGEKNGRTAFYVIARIVKK